MRSKKKGSHRRSIDEIVESLPGEERVIVNRLRTLILECLPTATEKNLYGAPFYTHHRMICFIWPPSIYWASKNRSLKVKGVTLGFCQGNLMSNEDGILLKENRRKMLCMYFKSIKEIRDKEIRALLLEADLIDQSFRKVKGR